MRRTRWIWLVWAVVLLSYALPYTLLTDVAAWYGSFLLWTLAGMAVIGLNIFITRDFEGD